MKKSKLNRWFKRLLRTERRKYNQRKRYCQKIYSDWVDDEFNYLDNKFIWALPVKGQSQIASFQSLNDAILYYNRATDMYYFDCDLSIFDCGNPESARHMLEYLERIQDAFASWYYENNYDAPIDEPFCEIFNQGICAKTLPMLKLQIDAMICGLQAILKQKHSLY